MNKIIGCRFYDYDSKKMIYLGNNAARDNCYMDCIMEIDEIGLSVFVTAYGETIPRELSKYEIMDYVCEEDKTKREIYIGDLYEDEEHQLYEVEFNNNDLCYELVNVFIPGSIALKCINDKNYNFKYVGNKYENKELLEI